MNHDVNCKPMGFVKWFLSWRGVVLTIVLAATSYYLLTEHRAHLAVALPYFFLLACPLMHIFGHGHGDHSKGQNDSTAISEKNV